MDGIGMFAVKGKFITAVNDKGYAKWVPSTAQSDNFDCQVKCPISLNVEGTISGSLRVQNEIKFSKEKGTPYNRAYFAPLEVTDFKPLK